MKTLALILALAVAAPIAAQAHRDILPGVAAPVAAQTTQQTDAGAR